MTMWPYGSTNPMAAKFEAAKEQASNLTQPGEQGTYSKGLAAYGGPRGRKIRSRHQAGAEAHHAVGEDPQIRH